MIIIIITNTYFLDISRKFVHNRGSFGPSSRIVIFPSFSEAHRALELLEDYHSKLVKPQDRQLRLAIERVIRIFKSRLFQALLGKLLFTSSCFSFINLLRVTGLIHYFANFHKTLFLCMKACGTMLNSNI